MIETPSLKPEALNSSTTLGWWFESWKQFKKNKGAVIGLSVIGLLFFTALFAPLLSPYDPSVLHTDALKLPPFFLKGGQTKFLLGTDDVGRDTLSRLIYGARVSLGVGLLVVLISSSVGITLGLIAGFFKGKADWIISRFVDTLMAFPSILLAIVVVSVLGPGLINAILAVSIVACPNFIRVARSVALSEREKDYVQAARSFGAGPFRILFREILPNCSAPLIVQISLGFSDGILNTAALGFLGLGAQPPTPEWGTMLADARAFIVTAPWMVTLPGLAIFVVVLGFNLLGDGLRDTLDPRLKTT